MLRTGRGTIWMSRSRYGAMPASQWALIWPWSRSRSIRRRTRNIQDAGAHDVYPAADGTVWFTAQSAGKLGRLDPKTGKSDMIALGPGAAPHGVIVGPDGAAWVTEGGQNAIARVDPATHAVKLFSLPKDRRDGAIAEFW